SSASRIAFSWMVFLCTSLAVRHAMRPILSSKQGSNSTPRRICVSRRVCSRNSLRNCVGSRGGSWRESDVSDSMLASPSAAEQRTNYSLRDKVKDVPGREKGSALEGEAMELKKQFGDKPGAAQGRHLLGDQSIDRKQTE